MNKKRAIIISIAIIFILLIGGFTYYFLTKEDKITTLNLFEKQWIENNKNNVIDMSIMSDIPILSYNGEGLIVDFLDSLNKETNLSFNKISYKLNDEVKTEYAFKAVDEKDENSILIYEDNYVIVTKEKTYLTIEELAKLNIGVLNDNLEKVNQYLPNADVSYKTYASVDELLEAFNNSETELNAIILLKTSNLKTIIDNNYKIAYNISDYKKYFVLSLGQTEKLNLILSKYYEKWSSDNYVDAYNKYLSKDYFTFKNINDSETVKFRSKRYTYGFIENAPYDTILDSKLAGVNSQLLSSFSKLTSAEISYKKYNNISEMLDAFNTNQIDLFYGINSDGNYAMDVYTTANAYTNSVVILKHSSNNLLVNSIKSLSNVMVLENSKLANYLTSNGISIIPYKNMKDLVKDIKTDSIIAMDLINYNYYSSDLKNYPIGYQFEYNNASFIIRDISDNKIFSEMFDFYIGFNDTKSFINSGLNEVLLVNKMPIILKRLAFGLGSIVVILLVILSILKIKPKNKKSTLSKEDKLRYIDALTSLKNRNYLNDSVEKWDSSEVYPQTIIIVDLNNIAYVNDNYGHAEGDAVIKQAANILILNQMENSEIIRTNGNEFLIYLVGYDEKQVITYMRKLNKELKELKHNFGAAIGYSMIHDAIKTIDDAINEATLDMRNNKEETTKE